MQRAGKLIFFLPQIVFRGDQSVICMCASIEEVGWEHLVRLDDNLTFLSFRVLAQLFGKSITRDASGRVHVMEVQVDKTYPQCPPSISGDVPYIPKIEWSATSRLKDAVIQFKKHVDTLEDFWSTLDDIDNSLWVVNPNFPCRAMCHRLVNIGNDCIVLFSINARSPKTVPECRFMGPDSSISPLRKAWSRNCKKWMQEKSFRDNLVCVFGFELPKSPDTEKDEQQLECGICYAQHLPIEDELGTKSGCPTDYQCDNANCRRAFHGLCLMDWLRSITTTRQSFDVLFGSCPYCSEPVAVKITNTRS